MKKFATLVVLALFVQFSFGQCWDNLYPTQDTTGSKYIKDADGILWKMHSNSTNFTLFDSTRNWKTVYEGSGQTADLGIKEDGSLWAWGDNRHGSYGNGTTISSPSPIQIGTETWNSLSSYNGYVSGIKSDSTLWIWGKEDSVPSQVGTGSNWKKVIQAYGGSLGLKSDGNLYLTDGNGPDSLVINDANWVDFYYGPTFIAGIRADGTMGLYNPFNFEHMEDQENTNWLNYKSIEIYEGSLIFLAIDPQGTLLFWHDLFTGPGTPATTVHGNQISTDSDWKLARNINANHGEVYALKEDGTLWIADYILAPNSFAFEYYVNGVDCGLPYIDVAYNNSSDCAPDLPLANWNIEINPGNYSYRSTSSGIALIDSLPDGTYTATLDTSKAWWKYDCPTSVDFEILNGKMDEEKSLVAHPDNPCEEPMFHLFYDRVRTCMESNILINVANRVGSFGLIENAQIIFETSEYWSLTSSPYPIDTLGPNLYSLDLPTINPGETQTLRLEGEIKCDAPMGHNICLKGHIEGLSECYYSSLINHFPQGSCSQNGDSSYLATYARCQGDSVVLGITNTGSGAQANMDCPRDFSVFMFDSLLGQSTLQLNQNESMELTFPSKGELFLITVDQTPNQVGTIWERDFVENCGSDNSNWRIYSANKHTSDKWDNHRHEWCQTINNSYDPNDKKGYPLGIGEDNLIEQNQPLDYVIQFQNTGNDTAFVVVVRDTLEAELDINSVLEGHASHPYTFKMSGQRVLEWTFNDINLLDSANHEEESKGFLTFRVKQMQDLPYGTDINNRVGIYFDANTPIITNTSHHRIDDPTTVSGVKTMVYTGKTLDIFPNPTSDLIQFEWPELSKANYQLMDISGRIIFEQEAKPGDNQLSLKHLPEGVYILKFPGYKSEKIIKH